MNVLQMNNYHFVKGGSESYYFSVSNLLKEKGHNVLFFSVQDNNNIPSEFSPCFGKEMSFDIRQNIIKKTETALRMLYSFENNKKMNRLLSDYKVDIAHAHNIYHRVNPSVLNVLRKKSIPVVMTLHDYKLCCSIYILYRDGQICTECIDKSKHRIVINNCTKESLLLSLFHWLESIVHSFLNLYIKNVAYFICPSRFSLKMHKRAGIPEGKLVHIPNFINIEDFEQNYENKGYILYAGRLSREKGVLTLLKAVKGLDVQMRIVGDGPMRKDYETFVKEDGINNVTFEGYKSGEELKHLFRNAIFLVFPSECYENAPMTILEAFAYGKPVVGSDIGGIPEMVTEGKTGMLFQTGNHLELKEKINYLIVNPSKITEMGKKAREKVELEYNAEIHYQRLMEVYQRAFISDN